MPWEPPTTVSVNFRCASYLLQIGELYVRLADAYHKVGDTDKANEARTRAALCMQVSEHGDDKTCIY